MNSDSVKTSASREPAAPEAYADPDVGTLSSEGNRRRSGLGTVLLFLGLGILGLIMADRTGGLPLQMPRSWYTDRSLWVAAGLCACGAGWYLLRDDEERVDDEVTGGTNHDSAHTKRRLGAALALGGPRFHHVVLYTRHGCHLCDEAKELLEMYREVLPTPIEVDIDADPALQARFTTCVPVVEIDGKIRFRGRVNAVLLRRLIAATPQRGDDRVELPGSARLDLGQ